MARKAAATHGEMRAFSSLSVAAHSPARPDCRHACSFASSKRATAQPDDDTARAAADQTLSASTAYVLLVCIAKQPKRIHHSVTSSPLLLQAYLLCAQTHDTRVAYAELISSLS